MGTDEMIKLLIENFNNHQREIEIIKKYKTSKEDWFIVNVFDVLEIQEKLRNISELCLEKSINTKGIDIYFKMHKTNYFIEIKHWKDEYKNGNKYPLSSWLSKGGGYIKSDMEKLREMKRINAQDKCLILIFYTCKYDDYGKINDFLISFNDREKDTSHKIYKGKNYYVLIIEILSTNPKNIFL